MRICHGEKGKHTHAMEPPMAHFSEKNCRPSGRRGLPERGGELPGVLHESLRSNNSKGCSVCATIALCDCLQRDTIVDGCQSACILADCQGRLNCVSSCFHGAGSKPLNSGQRCLAEQYSSGVLLPAHDLIWSNSRMTDRMSVRRLLINAPLPLAP
jgi:hypothetical protein